MNYFKKSFIVFFLVIFSCFEYSETLILYPNLSGRVQIEYKVPISKQTGKSLIYFLPVIKSEYEKIYDIKLSNFMVQDTEALSENFIYKQVNLEYEFRYIMDLEKRLYGLENIVRNKNEFHLYRTFPTAANYNSQDQIFSWVYNFIYEKFANRSLKFKILVPTHFSIVSNLGNLPAPGVLNFHFPLERTLDSKNPTTWYVTITLNPIP
ncbi:MAG: hypothetical protein NZ853_06685 [Leptospiraceae bacterium]|nr:hypothetical protein [Leptospiraceae bacterium]MDW7975881.1 hypothetical protein [Leptospiraceae bacterium]